MLKGMSTVLAQREREKKGASQGLHFSSWHRNPWNLHLHFPQFAEGGEKQGLPVIPTKAHVRHMFVPSENRPEVFPRRVDDPDPAWASTVDIPFNINLHAIRGARSGVSTHIAKDTLRGETPSAGQECAEAGEGEAADDIGCRRSENSTKSGIHPHPNPLPPAGEGEKRCITGPTLLLLAPEPLESSPAFSPIRRRW